MIHGRARARLGFLALTWTLLAFAYPGPAFSQSDADSAAIPAFVGYVNDVASVMSESERAKLEAFLDQVEKKTGAELAVLTVPTTAPLEPTEYKVRVFERWHLGKQGENNGLLMLVAIEEREVRFETGYGLEGVLPDGLQSRIVRDVMRPLLREGRMGEGITQGMLASAARIAKEKGVTLEWDGRELRYTGGGKRLSRAELVLLAAFFILFVIVIAVRMRNFRGGGPGSGTGIGWEELIVLDRMSRMGRRRGGWVSGGGWGGGFGGGGGGGPTFGGFGGGSSGGGGGGGSW